MAATCVRFAYLLKRHNADTEQRIEYAIFADMWMLIEINTAICGKGSPIMRGQLNLAVLLILINSSCKSAIPRTRITLVA